MTASIYYFLRFVESVFTTLIMYGFMSSMFRMRQGGRTLRGVRIFLCILLVVFVNSFNMAILNLCVVFIILTLGAVSMFRITLCQAFLYISFHTILMVNVELVCVFLRPVIGIQDGNITVMENLLMAAEIAAKILLVEAVKRQVRCVDTEREHSYMVFLSLLSTAIFALLMGGIYPLLRSDGENLFMVCSAVFFILADLAGFSMSERMMEAVQNQQSSLLTSQKAELSQLHYRKMEELTREYGAYVHELEHSLRTVRQLWESGNEAAADELAASAEDLGRRFRRKLYHSDPIINAILMEREKTCKEQGLRYEVSLASGLSFDFIQDIDKISMFGNLLDNAVEAALLKENGFVNVNLYMGNKSLLVFKTENSCSRLSWQDNGHYPTTKKDKKSHGFGIKKLRELTLKYNGILDMQQEEGVFTVSLILSTVQKTVN